MRDGEIERREKREQKALLNETFVKDPPYIEEVSGTKIALRK